MRKLIEKHKHHLNDLLPNLAMISALGVFGFGGYEVISSSIEYAAQKKETNQRIQEFKKAKNTAVFTYADKNNDGITTPQERSQLIMKVYKGKKIEILGKNKLQYTQGNHIGERVPLETLTQWFTDYKPTKTK